MSVVRSNPLPQGVFWLDVWRLAPSARRDGDPVFQKWVSSSAPNVVVHQRETHTENERVRIFYVFQVLAKPAPFPFVELGFPEVIRLAKPADVKPADTSVKSEDTVRKPPPGPMFDMSIFGELVADALGTTLGRAAIIGGLLYLFTKTDR